MRFCYYVCESFFVKGRGYRASIVFEGEHGHRPTGTWPYRGKAGETMPYFWGPTLAAAKQQEAECNKRLGLSAEIVRNALVSDPRWVADGARGRAFHAAGPRGVAMQNAIADQLRAESKAARGSRRGTRR